MSKVQYKRPWLCRIGWHDFSELDASMFTSVLRCTRCNQAEDPTQEARLEYERQMWSLPGMTSNQMRNLLAEETARLSRIDRH